MYYIEVSISDQPIVNNYDNDCASNCTSTDDDDDDVVFATAIPVRTTSEYYCASSTSSPPPPSNASHYSPCRNVTSVPTGTTGTPQMNIV
jgi:hypothetical protein